MRQRNDTPNAWSFAATPAIDDTPEQPPFEVLPGGTVDRPVLLDGWTAIDDNTADASTPPLDEPVKPLSKRRTAADNDKDGGEPR